MPNARPIGDFEPRWHHTDIPHRYGVGISMDCPHHGPGCRLDFYFVEPCDGYEPLRNRKLWGRVGGGLGEITIGPIPSQMWGRDLLTKGELAELTIHPIGADLSRPIRIPGHWTGWIIDGWVKTASNSNDPDDVPTEPGIPRSGG